MAQASLSWMEDYRQTFRLAVPIVLTQLSQIAMMVTDTIMIGRLGGAALAATTLATTTFFLMFVGILGIALATGPLASQYVGARQPRMVRRVVRQGFWVTLILSVPGMVVLDNADRMLLALGQDPTLVHAAMGYMATLMWSLPTAVGFIVLRNFVSALGRPAPAMFVMFGGVIVNIPLNYALIYGNFGLPRLELAGAGLGTALVDVAMFAVLLWISLRRRPFRRYHILGRFWRPDWVILGRIFLIGLPISGILLLEVGIFAAGSIMIGWIGQASLAGHQIALQIPHITFMVPLGIGQAATVRVGHAVGRRDPAAARQAGWSALTMGLMFMLVASLVIWFMPVTMVSWFVDADAPANATLIQTAAGMLSIAAIFQLFDGMQGIMGGALRGLNDTRVPFFLALVGYWLIGAPAAYLIGIDQQVGGRGVWMGLAIGLAVTALLLLGRFWQLTRRGYLPTVAGADMPKKAA